MAGAYPKPDGEKVTHTPTQFGWTNLPSAGRKGPAPKLPEWRVWHPATKTWWSALWKRPQALMWEQDGSTLRALACLYDDLISNRVEAARVSPEIRQHEDRHGLNPKSMLQLRWRVVTPDEWRSLEEEEAAKRVKGSAPRPAAKGSAGRRRAALRVIGAS
ncbi:MAG: hypothetical protein ACRDYV_04835 [Acidimicrobiia bacterium]